MELAFLIITLGVNILDARFIALNILCRTPQQSRQNNFLFSIIKKPVSGLKIPVSLIFYQIQISNNAYSIK
jgi:hypothetical protein